MPSGISRLIFTNATRALFDNIKFTIVVSANASFRKLLIFSFVRFSMSDMKSSILISSPFTVVY